MTALNATIDRFVGNVTTTNMASCTSPQWPRISRKCLHENTIYGVKTSKVERLALQYWYNSFLRPLRVDGRGFLHRKATLKKGSPDQKSKRLTCAKGGTVHFSEGRANANHNVRNVLAENDIDSRLLKNSYKEIVMVSEFFFCRRKDANVFYSCKWPE